MIDFSVALCSLIRGRSYSLALRLLCVLPCPSWPEFFSSPESIRRYGLSLDFGPIDFVPLLDFHVKVPCPTSLVFSSPSWLRVVQFGAPARAMLKQKQREGIVLPEGRRVTQLTTSVRGHTSAALNAWLRQEGKREVFLASPPDLDRINKVLTRYGRRNLLKWFIGGAAGCH